MLKRLLWLCVLVAVIAAAVFVFRARNATASSTGFAQLMTRGNALLETGDATGATALYQQALRLSPESTDVRLNLANAALLADRPADAVPFARQVLELDRNNAAAHYLLGCALLRQNQPEPAAAAFQQSWSIDPGVPALDFQMGLAQRELGHVPDAIRLFESAVRATPDHPSAHYQLSQLYRRVGQTDDANRALARHQEIAARAPANSATAAALERCKYTRPLATFVLAQPARTGIAVRFTEDTAATLGATAADYRAPLAVIDYERDGRPSLFAREKSGGFVLLDNRAGRFAALGRPLKASPDGGYRTALVGDLDNDGLDDVVVLGEKDSRVFKFYAQGRLRDATRAAGLEGVTGLGGVLADLHFSGNLDLAVVRPGGAGLALYRNLGNLSFDPAWTDSGLPTDLPGATQVLTADWNNESLPGVFVARATAPAASFAKKRSAPFSPGTASQNWPAGALIETADLDNDLRLETVIVTAASLEIVDREEPKQTSLPLAGFVVAGLQPVDFDNDGWLDLVAFGPAGLRVWRNLGHAGFRDVTKDLGLDATGPVEGLVAADFDNDGDTDLVTSSAPGLRHWRNDGGNQNPQFKLRLIGPRSSSSALGVRVELSAGDWRTSRVVRQQPLEIGLGRHQQLDALKIFWFDLSTSQVDVPVARTPHVVNEPTLPSGSCPYLYVWDGKGFRFVSDILGAAPLGLPMNEKMFVAADPEELLALGDTTTFPPKDGAYEVRLTEELREVLYLDEAHLVAIDHPVGTVVHPTSKMLPMPPFPQHELWTLRPLTTPLAATRSDGLDVTALLAQTDNQMVSPVQLRRDQLRGLAEPYSVTMDFGPLPTDRALVLALTGWIRFGGGMANISGSLDPTLPFPFPGLEAELAAGSWQKVAVMVGTPAGKTKTILVDLAGKLPAGVRRLRLSAAFEIYWDTAELCEKVDSAVSQEHRVAPARTDLRWHGYGRFINLPPSLPLTPSYTDVSPVPPWSHTPSGWFTRYGEVDTLVAQRDDRLALLAAGDELALSFDAAALPPLAPGMQRDFFLHVVGWDKDADFHVEQGWRLEPLPFTGMNDQLYGTEPRPTRLDDSWIKEFNTRWVDLVVPQPSGKTHAVP